MKIQKIATGTTRVRRNFWDSVVSSVLSSEKKAGKNVSVDVRPSYGSVISVNPQRGGGSGSGSGSGQDCSVCTDLPPDGGGPPTHILIERTISGTCGTGTLDGTATYDADLGFGIVGPIGGHFFCAHNIFTSSFGPPFWGGHYTCNGGPFYEDGNGHTLGFGGLLGRDNITCEWWFEMDGFLPAASCGGCSLNFAAIFEVIAGPGDPSGVYEFTETLPGGFTLATTVTIT